MFLKFIKFAVGFFIIFISISLFYNVKLISAETVDCVYCRCICDDGVPYSTFSTTKKATNCDSYCTGSAENSCQDLCGSSKIKSCEKIYGFQATDDCNNPGADTDDSDKKDATSGDDKKDATSGSGGLPTIIENPLCPPGQPNCEGGNPSVLVGRIIKGILGVVGSIALLIFIYGGFLWMTASGHSDMVQKGKDTLIWASIGLAVIFASYALVKFIFNALAPT